MTYPRYCRWGFTYGLTTTKHFNIVIILSHVAGTNENLKDANAPAIMKCDNFNEDYWFCKNEKRNK